MAQRRMLTETDREEISRGIVEGLEVQVIAARIDRSPSVVSRDIARHGGRDGYRAVAAQRGATEHRSRPKARKIDPDPGLHQRVLDKLRAGASPDQIAGRLRYEHPGQHAAWVSHEAIYTGSMPYPKANWPGWGSCCRPGGPNVGPVAARAVLVPGSSA